MTGSPPFRAALLGAAAVFALFLALSPWTTLWDRDEPRYAQATAEMLASGQFLVPTFNGQPRVDQPVLFHWLMALPMRALGPGELAARFWSPVGIALAALLTWLIGRRLLSGRAGLWALAFLAATPLALARGLTATPDALLLAAVTGALAAFASALAHGARISHLLAMTAALTLALLVGGGPGLAVPALAMAGALVWLGWGERTRVAPYAAVAGFAAAVSAALFMAWTSTVARLTSAGTFQPRTPAASPVPVMEGHGNFLESWPYALVPALLGFAPLTLFLPAAVSAVLGGRVGGARGRALLVGWMAPVFLGFLAVGPALALAVAGTLEAEREGRLATRDQLWLRRGPWLYIPVTLLAVVATLVVGGMSWRYILTALALAAVAAAVLRAHRAGKVERSARVMLAGAAAAHILAAGLVLPGLDARKPVPRLAESIRERTPESAPLAVYAFSEPSLVFYARRGPVAPLASERAVAAWSRSGGEGVLVIPREALREVLRAAGPLPLREIASAQGLDTATGGRMDLVALGRNLGPEPLLR